MTGGRRGRGGAGDSFWDFGVRSVQSVRKAVIHVVHFGRRIEVLHGAEVFGGDRLEGGGPETNLNKENQVPARLQDNWWMKER